MASSDVQRKLTAILCADVVGYSRLMGENEAATLRSLTENKQLFSDYIEKFRGRVVNAPGDSILAEFGSVVDAVECATDVQRELAKRNADMVEERRMLFRVGVNQGDVMVQGEELYGDAVNIAARLESLAEPGGVCISRPVHDQVRSKLNLGYEYMGEQQVKNISEPVRAYNVGLAPQVNETVDKLWEPISAVELLPDGISLELPDRPSIAVLPFANMSSDPEQDYFSDGIAEDLITDLSLLPRLFVIARNSSFQFKGQHVDVRKVGEELGVKYVLEGSVRKAGNQVRITAQLIDAATGSHIWAHRYDREISDIFALQDEITRDIAIELEAKIVEGEQVRTWRQSTSNPRAYDLALRGRDLFWKFSRAEIAQGQRLLQESLELDPDFTYAMVLLGYSYIIEGNSGRSKSPQECFDRAIELGNQTISLDNSFGSAYSLLCAAHRNKGEHEQAIEFGERSLTIIPDDADANAIFAMALAFGGRSGEAMEYIETAMRLNPYPPNVYLRYLGAIQLSSGKYEDAIFVLQTVANRVPDFLNTRVELTIAYMGAEREKEAQVQADQVLRIHPKFRCRSSELLMPHSDLAMRERHIEYLCKAGLPEL